ncbi:type I-E CRISPR-associated endoribonuclease Cas2e [Enemella evansiae]|uniref:type I-E CRISPR-associated endoribonuclease Cas2e n=1 Tax=Enemella evansiae TaxID=2016499 RepID=UPI001E658146|nr:type I-E CRISPR-associated endoribonuclease Cas2e [Enemella evansiae]
MLSKVPSGLRGHLTRWLMEVAPGVYVGKVSTRVREELWALILDMVRDGTALMVLTARNEQGLEIRNHRHAWTPEDFDGAILMRRPPANVESTGAKPLSSRAARFRRLRSRGK